MQYDFIAPCYIQYKVVYLVWSPAGARFSVVTSWSKNSTEKVYKMFEDEYEQMKGRNKRRREGKGRRKQPETAKMENLFSGNDEQHKEMKCHECHFS